MSPEMQTVTSEKFIQASPALVYQAFTSANVPEFTSSYGYEGYSCAFADYNRDGMLGIISTQAANQYPKRPNTYSPNSNIPSNHCMDASSAILRRRATAGEKTLKLAVARAQASPRES